MPQLPPPYLDEYQQRHKVRAVSISGSLTDHLLQVVLTEGPILDLFRIRFPSKTKQEYQTYWCQFQYPQYARNDDEIYVRLTDAIWTILLEVATPRFHMQLANFLRFPPCVQRETCGPDKHSLA